jgi:hypothetical protein
VEAGRKAAFSNGSLQFFTFVPISFLNWNSLLMMCGSGAVQGGKALPFRPELSLLFLSLSLRKDRAVAGRKAEGFPHCRGGIAAHSKSSFQFFPPCDQTSQLELASSAVRLGRRGGRKVSAFPARSFFLA